MKIRLVTIKGRTQSLKAWCREMGRGYKAVSERIRRGMDPVQAITLPIKRGTPGNLAKKSKREPTAEQMAWAKAEYKLRLAACVSQRVDISIRPTLGQILWEIVE